MKRIICVILAAVLLIAVLPFETFAIGREISGADVYYFDDGSYITVEIATIATRASGSVTGDKIYTYYAEDDSVSWKAILTGSFTYNGKSATCTASSCSVTINNSAWYTISKSASKSGDTAKASVTMGKKLLGVTVAEVPVTITLTCDANGNLS